jgi:DNA-binding transcriptional regulator YdaS (Cro superfamily)
MKLDEYLFRSKISKKDFALKIGVSREHIHAMISGKRQPSPKLAKKIQDATKGEVTKEELLFPEDFE